MQNNSAWSHGRNLLLRIQTTWIRYQSQHKPDDNNHATRRIKRGKKNQLMGETSPRLQNIAKPTLQ
jgi:hypothetical protein